MYVRIGVELRPKELDYVDSLFALFGVGRDLEERIAFLGGRLNMRRGPGIAGAWAEAKALRILGEARELSAAPEGRPFRRRGRGRPALPPRRGAGQKNEAGTLAHGRGDHN